MSKLPAKPKSVKFSHSYPACGTYHGCFFKQKTSEKQKFQKWFVYKHAQEIQQQNSWIEELILFKYKISSKLPVKVFYLQKPIKVTVKLKYHN